MACSVEIVTGNSDQDRDFEEYWTQRWVLKSWDNAEKELQEAGFFAIEEGYTTGYVFYDDKSCTLQQNGIWMYGEYKQDDPHPLDSIPKDSFGWEKKTFQNSRQAFDSLPFIVRERVKYQHLDKVSMFGFKRQPLFYLGIRSIKVYVDSMKVGNQFYIVGTFHRLGKNPFRINQSKFLTPARNMIFQMVWDQNPDLYAFLQDRKLIPSVSFHSHLSPKPFSPKLINKLPDSEEHRGILKHLTGLFPRSIEEQKKIAQEAGIPLVAHLHFVAQHTQPQNVIEGEEKPTFMFDL